MKYNAEQDAICLSEWQELNAEFNKLVESGNKKKELSSLLEKVKSAKNLTYRQTDSLLAKINNALAGEYGNTKTAAQMNVGKPESKK